MSERPTVAVRLYLEARLFPWRRRLGNGVLTAARGACVAGSAGVYGDAVHYGEAEGGGGRRTRGYGGRARGGKPQKP